jgi:molybdate transport system ATP-binding protein
MKTPSASSGGAKAKHQPAPGAPFITIEDVTVRVRDRFILPGTSWEIRTGESWAILGPNGAGKSSLARVLMDDVPTTKGTVKRHHPDAERDRIGWVSPELQEWLLGAEENRVENGGCAGRGGDPETARETILSGSPPGIDGARAHRRIVKRLGIGYCQNRPMRTLSTGELRKVLIARALMKSPRLLVLDEPFGGIDATSRKELTTLFGDLLRDGVQLVLVTHRADEIPPGIAHVLCVKNGRVVLQGRREEILSDWLQMSDDEEIPVPGLPRVDVRVKGAPEVFVEMKGVTVKFDDVIIFDNFDWTVKRGENWAVLGPNGAGKTTLLNLITGDNLQGYANEIYLFGVLKGSGETLWDIREKIGVVSSELQVRYRRGIQARDVVASGLFDSLGLFRRLSPEERRIVEDWMDLLGILPMAERVFDRLSYGERRMVLIARAMVKSPLLLILDEPCQGLDSTNRRKMMKLIDRIGAGTGTRIIYVSHYEEEIPSCINRALRLDREKQEGERTC